MQKLHICFVFLLLFSTGVFSQKKIIKTEVQWKEILSPMEYYILREKGTERATTGEYNNHYKDGIYKCAACKTNLFDSKNKYNSHSGWPAFDSALENNIKEITDTSYGMTRVEVVCAICDGHLGHVFEDGPKNTTGKRYCVNSASLSFQARK